MKEIWKKLSFCLVFRFAESSLLCMNDNYVMTEKEFEDIYRQHYARMYRLARTMLYDADESKDVVSDIFARLLRDGDRPQKDRMEGYPFLP